MVILEMGKWFFSFPMFKQLFQQLRSANSNDAFIFCQIETDDKSSYLHAVRYRLNNALWTQELSCWSICPYYLPQTDIWLSGHSLLAVAAQMARACPLRTHAPSRIKHVWACSLSVRGSHVQSALQGHSRWAYWCYDSGAKVLPTVRTSSLMYVADVIDLAVLISGLKAHAWI